MNSTEKKVLKKISENLKKSSTAKWKTGYYDDWVNFAKKMHRTIKDSVEILDSLSEETESKNKELDNNGR